MTFPLSDGNVLISEDYQKRLFGDGSDGVYSSGTNLTAGNVYQYTSFNLQNADTLTSTAANSGEPIIIKVQGNCTIAGTIDLSGKGYAAGDGLSGTAQFSGNDTGADILQKHSTGFGSRGADGISNTDGAAGGGHGGTAYPTELWMNYLNTNLLLVNSGAGGGHAYSSASSAGGGGGAGFGNDGVSAGTSGSTGTTGAGGAGGGAILFIVQGDVTFSGTIDISGEDGGDASAGGGGGGGGQAYILYAGSLSNTGTETVSGGAGGTGTNVNGGAGGDGGVVWDQLTFL